MFEQLQPDCNVYKENHEQKRANLNAFGQDLNDRINESFAPCKSEEKLLASEKKKDHKQELYDSLLLISQIQSGNKSIQYDINESD